MEGVLRICVAVAVLTAGAGKEEGGFYSLNTESRIC